MKLIGTALVIVSTTAIGLRIAGAFRRRPHQLRGLIQAIRMLQAEVEFSTTPLPLALANVAKRSLEPAANLFHAVSTHLKEQTSTVAEAFLQGIEQISERSALQVQDFEVVVDFSKTLGLADRVHQSQQFQVAITRLEGLEIEAKEAQRRYERLWIYLGFLSGLLLVIILY